MPLKLGMVAYPVVAMGMIAHKNAAIGPFTDARVSASVNDGEMKGSLLGMSYLQRFAKIEISGGRMVLTR